MEDKAYLLESSAISYTVGFEGDVIYCELIRRMKSCRLDQVTRIVKKKTSIGLGDETSFRIYFMENGKENKFPWIQVLITADQYRPFMEDLKGRLGSHVQWEDSRESSKVDASGAKVFDMQYLPFGYAGSGLGRGVQIWIYMICLAVLIIPLFYHIILLAKGGYRLYLTDNYLEIRKLSSRKIGWSDIESITFQQINVRSDSLQTTQVCKVELKPRGGRRQKWVMRYDHAVPFMKELVEKGILDEEFVERFV